MASESPIYATAMLPEVATLVDASAPVRTRTDYTAAGAAVSRRSEEEQTMLVQKMGMPNGITREFVRSASEFAKRFWIVDNSASMMTVDGHKLVHGSDGRQGMVTCSRWEELGENIRWHAQLSVEIGAYTEFRLLNQPNRGGSQTVRVGTTVISHFITVHLRSIFLNYLNSPYTKYVADN
jgi:hypothetical protein